MDPFSFQIFFLKSSTHVRTDVTWYASVEKMEKGCYNSTACVRYNLNWVVHLLSILKKRGECNPDCSIYYCRGHRSCIQSCNLKKIQAINFYPVLPLMEPEARLKLSTCHKKTIFSWTSCVASMKLWSCTVFLQLDQAIFPNQPGRQAGRQAGRWQR